MALTCVTLLYSRVNKTSKLCWFCKSETNEEMCSVRRIRFACLQFSYLCALFFYDFMMPLIRLRISRDSIAMLKHSVKLASNYEMFSTEHFLVGRAKNSSNLKNRNWNEWPNEIHIDEPKFRAKTNLANAISYLAHVQTDLLLFFSLANCERLHSMLMILKRTQLKWIV